MDLFGLFWDPYFKIDFGPTLNSDPSLQIDPENDVHENCSAKKVVVHTNAWSLVFAIMDGMSFSEGDGGLDWMHIHRCFFYWEL